MNAGWYADPWGRYRQRWHDGYTWSEHVHDGLRQTVDLPPGQTSTTLAPPSPHATFPPPTIHIVPAVTARSKPWRRFRNMPACGQIGIWIGVAFTALLISSTIAVAISPPKDERTESNTSFDTASVATLSSEPAPSTKARTKAVADTALPPRDSPTTRAPVEVVTAAPPTEVPTAATPTTTSTTAVILAPVSPTQPPLLVEVPVRSTCFDATGDSTDPTLDLVDSTIRHDDAGYYVFSAEFTGGTAQEVAVTFVLGEYQYQAGGVFYTDGTADAFVFDFADSYNDYVDDTGIEPGRFIFTVDDELLEDIAGTAYDYTVVLSSAWDDVDECEVTAFGTTG